MKKVVRVDLNVEPNQVVRVPFGEIARFGMWGNKPAIWIMCSGEAKEMHRRFRIYADGKDIPDHLNLTKLIGSFEAAGGDIGKTMLHVFEDSPLAQ